MKFFKLFYIMICIGFAGTSQAEMLWDNGDHDNGGIGLNNQNQSVMDDFYVPDAGWFINSAETHGIFLASGRVVTDVDVIIWPADIGSGVPNGDDTINISNVTFAAVDTGLDWEGYDKIKVTVNFDSTFLKGQEYFWIELDIKDQYGHRMKLLERQSVNYLPAHLRSNPHPFSSGKDLGYKLFGTPVSTFNVGGPSKFKLDQVDTGSQTVSLKIVGEGKRLDPGFYQVQMDKRTPVLYRFDEKGKQRYDFKPNPKEPARLSTPLGDDMCQNTSGSLHDFCQSFVACAAYDLFCL